MFFTVDGTTIKNSNRFAENKIGSALNIAVLHVYSSETIGIVCVLIYYQPAVIKTYFIAVYLDCDSLSYSSRTVFKSYIFSPEIIGQYPKTS